MTLTVITTMWILVVMQIYFEYRHHHGHKGPFVGITKTCGSLLFVAAALLCQAQGQSGGSALLLGLCLSVLGDIFLISEKRHFFLMGIGTFLLAHIAYCAAFIAMNIDLRVTLIAAPFIITVGVFIARWLWPHVARKMKLPVLAYITAICTMVTLSAGVLTQGGAHFTLAAVAFMISDVFVARDRFVKTEFPNRLYGLPLYYGAQIIFATSLVIAPFFEIV